MAQGSSLRLLVLFITFGLIASPSFASSDCTDYDGFVTESDKNGPVPVCQVVDDDTPVPFSDPGEDELTNTADSTQNDEPGMFAQAAAVVNEVSETIVGAINGLINGAR